MKNIKDLRDSLLESFEKLKNGTLDLKQAKEETNMAGKIILSAKVQSDYNNQTDNGRSVGFLECEMTEEKDQTQKYGSRKVGRPRKK